MPRHPPSHHPGTEGPPERVPAPARPSAATLPHALTFVLTASQRRAALRALGRLDRHRERALLRALGLEPGNGSSPH